MLVNGIDHARLSGAESVLEMICAAARTHADRIAVTCGTRSISYADMMAAANANAVRLAACGVAPRDMVLCALSTGVELPLAWLSVMIAGAVIVPIDARWPAMRLQAVVAATGARLAIGDGADNAALAATGLQLYGIDVELPVGQADAGVAPPTGADLLYGFFTSGSTGTPKCALNHHAGLVNRFSYMTRRFGQGHVVYQNSAPLFDSSIWQMLWPLTGGSVSVLPERRDHWDIDTVVADISRHGISMTDFVPTLFKLLVRALENGSVAPVRLASLRNVLIGGEEIDPASVHTFRRLMPRCRIINTYGHTEASIGMVFHEVRDEDGEHIPLGRPIDNTYVRIVDADMKTMPEGEFGEMAVAGICVGAGYLNMPELSARAFVPNPFRDLPGELVYRTGDIGRVRADGMLEYGGRTDDQVKVRGVRIELGEVSLAMKACFPQVQDAMAVVVPNSGATPAWRWPTRHRLRSTCASCGGTCRGTCR
ncbi:amino acid adenylation domain-containing protein [Massilia cavernae]|uniref:Amino acid adenylation domain-containing protein n=1 Tax=Massilia cavernae TaxID=2320864 RepID=A0A418XR89_9BURK|nr:amino acid adenylation domain-containing protein [Massilia cavernae]RJG15049.1 amino acid adenylation domain-containing protein [Massilia cavernae]